MRRPACGCGLVLRRAASRRRPRPPAGRRRAARTPAGGTAPGERPPSPRCSGRGPPRRRERARAAPWRAGGPPARPGRRSRGRGPTARPSGPSWLVGGDRSPDLAGIDTHLEPMVDRDELLADRAAQCAAHRDERGLGRGPGVEAGGEQVDAGGQVVDQPLPTSYDGRVLRAPQDHPHRQRRQPDRLPTRGHHRAAPSPRRTPPRRAGVSVVAAAPAPRTSRARTPLSPTRPGRSVGRGRRTRATAETDQRRHQHCGTSPLIGASTRSAIRSSQSSPT